RFLRTDPLGLSSGRFLRFRLYQTVSVPISSVLSSSSTTFAALFLSGGSDSIRRFRRLIPSQRGLASGLLGPSGL
ncbi:hypothetical protein, partial [Streptomyces sp. NPDC005012]|uniref:hypothetical protein n=1 Tax=Streptomyces sp. NPDC005012 TaxID=3154558 RepID=UPI0033A4C5D6